MFQTAINLTDTPRTEYNGWSDWTTWNCALWIGNDEGLYEWAKGIRNSEMFIELMREFDMKKTPDGAKWEKQTSPNAGDDGRIINCHTRGSQLPPTYPL